MVYKLNSDPNPGLSRAAHRRKIVPSTWIVILTNTNSTGYSRATRTRRSPRYVVVQAIESC
jgi:hypothetical protein